MNKIAAPPPFNRVHANAHGRWCKCGAPIWRWSNERYDSADVRAAFERRTQCRACALVALSSQYVRDAEEIRRDIDLDFSDEGIQGLQDTAAQVALGADTQSGERRETFDRWGRTDGGRKAANDFVPHPDMWKERMPSTHIGYRARHVIEINVLDLVSKARLHVWTLDSRMMMNPRMTFDIGTRWRALRNRDETRSAQDVADCPDGDLFVSDEPR